MSKVVPFPPVANPHPAVELANEWLNLGEMLAIGRQVRPGMADWKLKIALMIDAERRWERRYRPGIDPPEAPVITTESRAWPRAEAEQLFRNIRDNYVTFALAEAQPESPRTLEELGIAADLLALEGGGKICPKDRPVTMRRELIRAYPKKYAHHKERYIDTYIGKFKNNIFAKKPGERA